MSHHPVVYSPEGTALPDRTVGELVAERPGRSRIFQSHRIDFCCQGGRTLREACDKRGVALALILEELEAEAEVSPAEVANPAALPAPELITYIVENHHGFLRNELPRLQAMADRVAHVHGGHTASLVEVRNVFTGLRAELESHIMKEEQILFPAIAGITSGTQAPTPLDGPISCMLREHEDAGGALEHLSALTSGYTPPADACNTYRALFAGLADLEEDLHRHIHLENAVLFPVVQDLIERNAVPA